MGNCRTLSDARFCQAVAAAARTSISHYEAPSRGTWRLLHTTFNSFIWSASKMQRSSLPGTTLPGGYSCEQTLLILPEFPFISPGGRLRQLTYTTSAARVSTHFLFLGSCRYVEGSIGHAVLLLLSWVSAVRCVPQSIDRLPYRHGPLSATCTVMTQQACDDILSSKRSRASSIRCKLQVRAP